MASNRGRYLIQVQKRGWDIGWETVGKSSTLKSAGHRMESASSRPVRVVDSRTGETVNHAIA